jgi:hypothetical protein
MGGLVASRFGVDFCAEQKYLSPLYVIAVGNTVLISVIDTCMSLLLADTVQTQLLSSVSYCAVSKRKKHIERAV